jgi:hypothetical protein
MSSPDPKDATHDQKIKDLRGRLDALNRAPVKVEIAVDPMADDLRRALAAGNGLGQPARHPALGRSLGCPGSDLKHLITKQ